VTWGVKRPDLVLEAPVLVATKPRGLLPNRAVPSNIVVVGIPFTGAAEVASLLATALDWSYTDLRTATVLSLGISANPADQVAAETEVAERFLDEAKAGARFNVWAWNAVGAIDAISEIGSDRPLVIFLEASDELVEFSESRGYVGSKRAQDLVRGALFRRDPSTCLILHLPTLPLPPPGELNDVDVFFDAYVDCAFAAAKWLCEEHGGPELDAAPGVIGELWRATGDGDA
jgi:hypothetical protein